MKTILIVFLFLIASAASAGDFFVSPKGNDANPGTADMPFATLTRARDAIRTLKARTKIPPKTAMHVNVADGVYSITEPFVLLPEDSGTKDAPIIYRAMPGAHPVFNGGRVLPAWQAEKNGIWTTEAPKTNDGALRFEQLFVNGRRATRARSPNDSYFYMQDVDEEVLAPGTKELRQAEKARQTVRMRVSDFDRVFDKLAADDLRDMVLVVHHNWDITKRPLDSCDAKSHSFVTIGKGMKQWNPWRRNTIFHMENFLAALDSPGEWHLAPNGRLFYKPRLDEDMNKATAIAPVADKFMVIKGDPTAGKFVEHVKISGLTFQYARWLCPPGGFEPQQAAASVEAVVMADGARNVTIENCDIGHVGAYVVWFRNGCRDCELRHSRLHDFGAGGVRIGEAALNANEKEQTGRIIVDNNIIQHGGYVLPCAVGVWIGQSADNVITHNDIGDLAYTGISVGWRWGYGQSPAKRNDISFNRVHHIGRGTLSDMGGIYMLGKSEGTVVRNNVFHDIYAYSYGGWGMYADEGSSNILFENNLVYRTKSGGFHQHYGMENVVRNNIFALNKVQQVQATRVEDHRSFTLERNIFYWNTGTLLAGPWDKLNYVSRDNCFWNAGGQVKFLENTLDAWQRKGHENGSQISDPKFADPKRGDFSLAADSPALKLGFKPFDHTQAGVYGDPAWTRKAAETTNSPWTVINESPPREIVDDFDATEVGKPPRNAEMRVDNKGDSIEIVAIDAPGSKRCVKIVDAPGLRRTDIPYMAYAGLNYGSGRVFNSFKLMIDPKTNMRFEWRDNGKEGYHTGPQFIIRNGHLHLGQRRPIAMPAGKWVKFELVSKLGTKKPCAWALRLTIPGRSPLTFRSLPYSVDEFSNLNWIGFVSLAQEKTSFLLDEFEIRSQDQAEQ